MSLKNGTEIRDEVMINAPIGKVWEAIKNPLIHLKWHPFMTRIDGKHAFGEVRKCDVKVGNETGHTEERCVQCDDKGKIMWLIEKDSSGFSSMVSDWMTGFSLQSHGPDATMVTALSTFRLKNETLEVNQQQNEKMFHQTQQAILTRLKQFVEKNMA